MTIARKIAVVALVAGAVLAGGCGPADCNATPLLSQAPGSCTLAPSSDVTVRVRWCSCGASTVCEVTYADGVYQLDPKVNSCDASCPSNPTSCDYDTVPCTFTTPASGSFNLYVIDGSTFESVPLSIGGSSTLCGPT